MCCSKKRCAPQHPATEPRLFAYPACANGISYRRRGCGSVNNGGGCHSGGPGLIRSLFGAYKDRKAEQQQAQQQQQQRYHQQAQYPHVMESQVPQMPQTHGVLARHLSNSEEEKGYVFVPGDVETGPARGERLPRYEEVMKT